jgi:diguanylate cyclase (GGDEF)-like protein
MENPAVADRFNILLVDDDPTVVGVLGHILQDVGRLRFATSGPDALRLARQNPPDLVLLDIEMPGMSGFEVCTAMKESPTLADVPIIFITSHDGGDEEVTGLSLGGVDFIGKPPRSAQVVARVRMHLRMKQMADALRSAAYTDGLTGVANRRHFDEALHREWLRAQRACTPLSLVMADIDTFKLYNDHYGHQAGDRCLQVVALALRHALHRPADLAARYGGEEFAVLLPETDGAGARYLALQLQDAVADLKLAHASSPVARHVSLSIGVSSFDQDSNGWVGQPGDSRFNSLGTRASMADLVAAADQALYAAKAGGRNCVRFLNIDDLGLPARALDPHQMNPSAAVPAGLEAKVRA